MSQSELAVSFFKSPPVNYIMCSGCGDEFFGEESLDAYKAHVNESHAGEIIILTPEEKELLQGIHFVAEPNSGQCGMTLEDDDVRLLLSLIHI